MSTQDTKLKIDKTVSTLIVIVSVLMVVYHLIYTFTLILGPLQHQNMHLLLALLLVFLSGIKNTWDIKKRIWNLVMILGTVLTTSYIFINFDALEHRAGMNTPADIVIGIIILIIVWEATRQATGLILPAIALFFIIYTLFGQYFPGVLWHFKVPLSAAITKFDIGFSGVFGQSLGISADYIFMFMVFGAFLEASGGSTFFIEIGKLIGKHAASGSGMAAIVSCGMVGGVTGSGMADVAIVGPFAVPMMTGAGYKKEQVAGILTAAATGALLVPPVMGVVAFVMAEYMGVPYLTICLISIIPALIYYFCIGSYVHLYAKKRHIKRMGEEIVVDVKELIKTSYLFLIPFAAILILLLMGFSLRLISAVITIMTFALSLIRKKTRGNAISWARICTKGACSGAGIAAACGLVGVILASFDITSLGFKLPSIIRLFGQGNLTLTLILVGLVTIVLGCGIPPFASYMIVAMMCAPVLHDLGLSTMQAHYFLFLFSVFGQMTPPVAITAVAAAPICGTTYLKASIEAVKAGWVAWLLPFFVVWAPSIILDFSNPAADIIKLVCIVLMVYLLQAAYIGYFLSDLNNVKRCICAAAGFLFIVFCFTNIYPLMIAGLVLTVIAAIGKKTELAN